MTAYYNEIDPAVCQWLENLIKAGHIAPGRVDNRSISDVKPSDLAGYSQCHFFAGIGVWSYALRCAGWDDDRPVWTASCPCQPFSTAGKGSGFADERHLWPDLFHLVTQCKPDVIFGEQVASKDAESWIDLVQADLEGMDYAFGAAPFPAASVGAPHIRDRLYWVADNLMQQRSSATADRNVSGGRDKAPSEITGLCQFSRLGNNNNKGLAQRVCQSRVLSRESQANEREASQRGGVHFGGLANVPGVGLNQGLLNNTTEEFDGAVGDSCDAERQPPSCPTNGFWSDVDWLFCRDGKWRPVEPGTFPLAHGAACRVGRLRAYGNCIVAPQAQLFIECLL